MTAIDLIRRLHFHRAWVNRMLLDAAENVDDVHLKLQFPIGQGSLWKTLTHLYGGEYIWLEALLGNPDPVAPGDVAHKLVGNQEGEGAMQSLAELRTAWTQLESRWSDYLANLQPEALDEPVDRARMVDGKRQVRTTRRSDVLLHVCTHAHYTTAQAINMLRHIGVETLPDPMLITLARQEMA